MFSDDLVLHVTNKAKLYAVQHGKDNLNILEDEIRTFISFLLLSGYCKVPCHIKIFIGQMHLTHTMKQSHMQWTEKDFERYYQTIWLTTHRLQKIDTTNYEYYLKSWISISNSMVHLSITTLMKALSLTMENTAQNNLLEESPLGLGLNFGASPHLKDISILWSIYWFDKYWSGSGCRCCDGLIERCEVKAGSTVAFGNLFTSLPLLDEQTELGIGALGTLRKNRFHGAPVTNKTTLAKKPRGCYGFATDGKKLVMSWLDNRVVTCAANYITSQRSSTMVKVSQETSWCTNARTFWGLQQANGWYWSVQSVCVHIPYFL